MAHQLRIDAHQVHRIDGDDLIISTLKDITISVVLVDPQEQAVDDAEMPLTAHLIYENGQPVEQLDRHQPVMKGGTAHMTNGLATFKLRINVLSSLRGNQKLRVLVVGQHRECGKLEVITNPMRSITKLYRGPRELAEADRANVPAPQCATTLQPAELQPAETSLKRKAEIGDLLGMINDHDRSIGALRESQRAIVAELQELARRLAPPG